MSVAALAEHTGEAFGSIVRARERTAAGLAERRSRLDGVVLDPDACVALLGSWGRREVTSASDDDAIVLFTGVPRERAQPDAAGIAAAPRARARPDAGAIAAALGGPAPGREGIFGATVWLGDLTGRIGL